VINQLIKKSRSQNKKFLFITKNIYVIENHKNATRRRRSAIEYLISLWAEPHTALVLARQASQAEAIVDS